MEAPYSPLPNCVRNDLDIRCEAKVLMTYLISFAAMSASGLIAYPNNERLAKEMGLSVSTVQRAIKQLIDKEYISRKLKYIQNKDGTLSTKRTLVIREDFNNRKSPVTSGRKLCSKPEVTSDPYNKKEKISLLKRRDNLSLGKDRPKFTGKKSSLVQENKSPRNKKPKRSIVQLSKAKNATRSIIKFWNDLPNTITHRETSFATERSCWLLENRILKRHGSEVIKNALIDYDEMLGADGAFICGSKSVPLNDFLEIEGFTTKVVKDRISWLQRLVDHNMSYWLVNPHKSEVGNNGNLSELRSYIIGHYQDEVIGERKNFHRDAKMIAKFNEAAIKLNEYMKGGRLEKQKGAKNVDQRDYVFYLLKSLADFCGSYEEIHIGNLCSNYTYTDVLPKYLTKVLGSSTYED